MGRNVEEAITATARRQHGVVTRVQLLELGIRPGAIRCRMASGRLRRLHRGVYLVGPIMPPHAREMAAVLACGPAAVLSHRSAATLWGLTAAGAEDAPVDVAVPHGHDRRRPGIRVHRIGGLGPEEWTRRSGIPVTAPARTLLDFAGVAGRRELERAVARAERERLLSRAELLALVVDAGGRRGIATLRAVLGVGGGPMLTRSEAEAEFLALIRKARLPAPEANVRIEGYEVDFLWRAERIAVEIDGYRYHASRSSFERDRRRAAHLAAHGIQVIPLTWRQVVDDGVATAVQLGQALLSARRQ